MKVFQKILSHGLLITFFVAVFFLYLYRAALFPQWFGDSADTSANSAVTSGTEPSTSQVVAPDKIGGEPEREAIGGRAIAVQSPSVPSPALVAPAKDESGLPPLVVDDEPASSGSNNLPPLVTDNSGPVSPLARDQAVPEAAAASPAEVVAVPAEQAPMVKEHSSGAVVQPPGPESRLSEPAGPVQADEASPSGPAAPAQGGAVALPAKQPAAQPETTTGSASTVGDYQSQLFAARELYWKRGAENAVNAYTQLLQSYPDRADGWGELGNLYMAFGQTENAADAYSQAIDLLIHQDRREEASNMLAVMRTLDPAKATELGNRLEQAER